jgi:hypothetical protein
MTVAYEATIRNNPRVAWVLEKHLYEEDRSEPDLRRLQDCVGLGGVFGQVGQRSRTGRYQCPNLWFGGQPLERVAGCG